MGDVIGKWWGTVPKWGAVVAWPWRFYRNLAHYDVVAAFSAWPALSVQLGFAVVCTLGGIALRNLIDVVWTGAGPFGLVMPAVLVATFFGRWQAGAITLAASSLYAWYYVLPVPSSFAFAEAGDGPRIIVNVLAGGFVVALAELFRRTMRQALHDRELLLREIEHRVKNNFASVAGLLKLQIQRYEDNPTIVHALQAALGRVESYAIVNSFLYLDQHYTGLVNMKGYLEELCALLEESIADDAGIAISCQADTLQLPRDRAILVGLLANEAITNAIKHAFGPDGGRVGVTLDADDEAWALSVTDDGRGLSQETRTGSFGSALIAALAKQAEVEMSLASDASGTRYTFEGSA